MRLDKSKIFQAMQDFQTKVLASLDISQYPSVDENSSPIFPDAMVYNGKEIPISYDAQNNIISLRS